MYRYIYSLGQEIVSFSSDFPVFVVVVVAVKSLKIVLRDFLEGLSVTV